MIPGLLLSFIAANPRVLEAALVRTLVPMCLGFWSAHGVEMVGRLLRLTLAQRGAQEEEIERLREQVAQVERARRAELEVRRRQVEPPDSPSRPTADPLAPLASGPSAAPRCNVLAGVTPP